jgi:hypothetical protein
VPTNTEQAERKVRIIILVVGAFCMVGFLF